MDDERGHDQKDDNERLRRHQKFLYLAGKQRHRERERPI